MLKTTRLAICFDTATNKCNFKSWFPVCYPTVTFAEKSKYNAKIISPCSHFFGLIQFDNKNDTLNLFVPDKHEEDKICS